ncbi:MAG: hypothetical protein QM582_07790 [Micropruina sp.]|uniref:hypothetical protein n=1 Tax=Micropruina sp. TaxID=2737536 RepID=UPI0039E3AA15
MESLIALPTHRESAKRPNRHGQPWVIADYELLVQGVREGLELPALASRIGRTETVLLPRLRRLLPVAQRDCFPELVLDALRTALADDGYDWRHEMLLSPPIVRNEIIRSGLDGLTDDQAVTIGYALLASGGAEEAELFEQLAPRLSESRLMDRLVDLRACRVVRSSPYSVDADSAWAHASYWVHGRRGYRNWHHQQVFEPDW